MRVPGRGGELVPGSRVSLVTHCPGNAASRLSLLLLSSEKLGMGTVWDALQSLGTGRQVQRAPPSGRVWGAVGPAGSHSSSTAFSAPSSAPRFPPPCMGRGSCGLCRAGVGPGRRLGTGEVRLLAEGGSLSSAVWVSACPSWSLRPLPGPTQWPLRAPNSYLGPQGDHGAEWPGARATSLCVPGVGLDVPLGWGAREQCHHPAPTAGCSATGPARKASQRLCARACPALQGQVENVNGPEDTNPASSGPGTPDAAPRLGAVGAAGHTPRPRGPWAATPELGQEQSQAQVLALMEAVSLRVRPLQMPHPQKFRAAGTGREAPSLKLSTSSQARPTPSFVAAESCPERWSQPGAR